MTKEQTQFLLELNSISTGLMEWAQERLNSGWNLHQVKDAMKTAAKLAERD